MPQTPHERFREVFVDPEEDDDDTDVDDELPGVAHERRLAQLVRRHESGFPLFMSIQGP